MIFYVLYHKNLIKNIDAYIFKENNNNYCINK